MRLEADHVRLQNNQQNKHAANTLLGKLHRRFIHSRRVEVLARHIAELIPKSSRVLDVGSGDGLLASTILKQRSDITIEAIDTLVRPHTLIPTKEYDGNTIPFADNTFDTVLLVDVLHHVDNVRRLLAESNRVSRICVIIKDHFVQGLLARPTLLLMDNVSNRQYGVSIPANYLTEQQWQTEYDALGLATLQRRRKLGLYPPPLSWFFERNLHFIDLLQATTTASPDPH